MNKCSLHYSAQLYWIAICQEEEADTVWRWNLSIQCILYMGGVSLVYMFSIHGKCEFKGKCIMWNRAEEHWIRYWACASEFNHDYTITWNRVARPILSLTSSTEFEQFNWNDLKLNTCKTLSSFQVQPRTGSEPGGQIIDWFSEKAFKEISCWIWRVQSKC